MTLLDYIKSAGYTPVAEEYYERINGWKLWYQGKVDRFHNYMIQNGGKAIRRTRASLNMAKHGCEYWANLLWNSKCAVNLENADADQYVNRILQENDFGRQTNVLIERAWALGCGAYVVYDDAGRTVIDYVAADGVFPLSWRNDDIESCAFAASYNEGKKRLLYVMIHEKQASGGYVVYNRFFEKSESGNLTLVPPPASIKDEYSVNACRFSVIKPNIANNLAAVPLGLSVYANCVDTLMSVDLAYDGIKTAMEIGRPRIGVSSNMLTISEDGELRTVFDPNDLAVYDLGYDQSNPQVRVEDLTTPYRALEYEQSLQTQLTVYAQCIGLGENSFKWDRAAGDVSKTATEVIASNSVMYRAMEKHQDGLRSAIARLVQAILDIGGRDPEQDIKIAFDDSVTRDKGQEALEAWQWVMAGKYPFSRFLVDFKGYDKKEASDIVAEASEGQRMFPGEDA